MGAERPERSERTPRRVLWLVPLFIALHNLEEALAFPHYLAVVRQRMPPQFAALAGGLTTPGMLAALSVATIVPVIVVTWAMRRPASIPALWTALLVQAVVALNVVSHVVTAVFLLHGYTPGLITALLVNLPFSVFLFRRAIRERWLGSRAFLALVPGALIVHGPVLIALIAGAQSILG